MSHTDEPASGAGPRRSLSLFDASSIIVGIMIGSTIYESSPRIADNLPSAAAILGVWLLGGCLALVGALCYAELASAYPREGGEYVFLSRAYGRRTGLLFAWADYWVVRPGNIGAVSYIFAVYASELSGGEPAGRLAQFYAVAAVIVLTGLNILGVRSGKWTQNVLTVSKTVGLLLVFAVGMLLVAPAPAAPAPSGPPAMNWPLALILVMFAYGGWSDIACVAAEVQRPRRNLLRALVLGTTTVALVYLLVNVAFLRALGRPGLAGSGAAAADLLALYIGPAGRRAVSLLICVSCLGAINGMIFTGARIYYAVGTEHRPFAWIGRWNARLDAPVISLVLQGAVTVLLILAFGPGKEAFEGLVVFTTPVYWLFAMLVGFSIYVLRRRDPSIDRPYRVIGYPLTPLVFCAMGLFLMWSSVEYAWSNQSWKVLWSLVLLAIGGLVCLVDRQRLPAGEQSRTDAEEENESGPR